MSLNIYAQEKDSLKINTENLLNELSDNACKCIDSIKVFKKSQKNISEEVGNCIDKQTTAYQMGVKLIAISSTYKNKPNSDVTIEITTDENSNEYKKYYYEIERKLVENCNSIKNKLAGENKIDKNSISEDSKAIEFYQKGQLAFEEKKYKEALKNYQKAVEIDKNFAFAWDNIGLCNRYLENYEDAIVAYEKSIKINPKGLMPLQNLAIVYSYKKDYENAILTYERLAKIDDKNPEVFYGIGIVCYQYTKEYEKALNNMCIAYNLYVELKSAYRSDAEKVIGLIFTEFKKENKVDRFYEILKENKLTPEKE